MGWLDGIVRSYRESERKLQLYRMNGTSVVEFIPTEDGHSDLFAVILWVEPGGSFRFGPDASWAEDPDWVVAALVGVALAYPKLGAKGSYEYLQAQRVPFRRTDV